MMAELVALFVISSLAAGVFVPTPTFPLARIVIRVDVEVPPVVEATVKSGVLAGVVAEFEIERSEYGEVVPTPTLPLARTAKREEVAKALEVVDAISNSLFDEPRIPCIDSCAQGVVVPMPIRPVEAWA